MPICPAISNKYIGHRAKTRDPCAAQVEESARRQDEERTIIAQARAQSATELSVSRRLKSELTRAVVAQQNQRRHMSQPMLMPGDVNPTALRPAAKVSTSHNPGSPSSAALQEWRRSVDCGNAAGESTVLASWLMGVS